MANLADLNTIGADARFQGRCMQALRVAAMAAMTESASTQDHEARAEFARLVLGGQSSSLNVACAVLTNATIAAEADVSAIAADCAVSDGDIQYTVNSIFNALAGLANVA